MANVEIGLLEKRYVFVRIDIATQKPPCVGLGVEGLEQVAHGKIEGFHEGIHGWIPFGHQAARGWRS